MKLLGISRAVLNRCVVDGDFRYFHADDQAHPAVRERERQFNGTDWHLDADEFRIYPVPTPAYVRSTTGHLAVLVTASNGAVRMIAGCHDFSLDEAKRYYENGGGGHDRATVEESLAIVAAFKRQVRAYRVRLAAKCNAKKKATARRRPTRTKSTKRPKAKKRAARR